jgi:hypothetical protein
MFLSNSRLFTKSLAFTNLATKRCLSSTTKFIPCTSCIHYDSDTRKCDINFKIKDEKNYAYHASGDLLAVDARNNELYCGTNASKFKYSDRNYWLSLLQFMLVSFGWSFPIALFDLLFDSYIMFVPYIIHSVIIYQKYEPTYNPNSLPVKSENNK